MREPGARTARGEASLPYESDDCQGSLEHGPISDVDDARSDDLGVDAGAGKHPEAGNIDAVLCRQDADGAWVAGEVAVFERRDRAPRRSEGHT